MLEINNQQNFGKAIAQAIAKIAENPQGRKIENWVKQIARAAFEIENNPFMHYDAERETMVIVSTEVYEANGVCQCKGALNGKTCWHRIAKRIWQLYLEIEAKDDEVLNAEIVVTKEEMDNAIYCRPASSKPVERIKGIRI